jgi:plastocyanin
MTRIRLLLAAAAVALVAAAPTTAGPTASHATKLTGTTGPGFTITLKKAGVKVRTLKAGKYTITVTDKSSQHDFVLKGPGITNKMITGLSFKGTKSATVTLRKGTYTYFCTPHAKFGMKGTFKAT